MKLDYRQSRISILFALIILSACMPLSAQQSQITISTPEQLKAEFESVPCKNEDRLSATKALFEKMGAPASDISIEKYKNVENLVIHKPGTSQEKIIIGAHYDKVSAGCGAIDNWTGIVTMAYLYKSLKNVPLEKTILFVAFGKEKKGRIGSKAMVNAISKEQLSQYCEMINIDNLGLAPPQVADSMSSRNLRDLVAALAEEMKIPFGHASMRGYVGASNSFIERKIPAVMIHGLTVDGLSFINSREDQPSKVKLASVYWGYRLVLALIIRLDNLPCGEYR